MLPPVPVDADTMRAIKRQVKKTRLSQADVVRQSIHLGLPQVARGHSVEEKRKPRCLNWLDDYPLSPVAARDTKAALKEDRAEKWFASLTRVSSSHCGANPQNGNGPRPNLNVSARLLHL